MRSARSAVEGASPERSGAGLPAPTGRDTLEASPYWQVVCGGWTLIGLVAVEAVSGGVKRVAAPGLGASLELRIRTRDLDPLPHAMGPHLCLCRAALLPGSLLFLLLLSDPALPTGRPPPVVLGEARVQSWVRSLLRQAGQGAGMIETVFSVCSCSKHEVGERVTDLSPGWVRPPPAILVAGVVNLSVTFPYRIRR